MEADYATNLRPRISGMTCLCAYPDFYGVTISLIVISSKSDKFFERHLPGRLFVPSPPIRHFPSFSSRDAPHELPSNRDNIPIRPYLLKSLDLCGVWDVSASVAWVYYKAKG